MKVNNTINQFNEDLVSLINSYNNLPIGVVYYVLKDCLNEVKQAYEIMLKKEDESQEEQQEEENN